MSTTLHPEVNKAISTALEALRVDDPKVRHEARELLERLGTPAVEPLLGVLPETHDRGDERTRREVLHALGAIADERATEAFLTALEDDCADCRWAAAEGLIGLGWAGLLRTLDELVEFPGTLRKLHGVHHVLHGMRRTGYCRLVQPVLKAFVSDIPEIDVPRTALRAAAEMHRRGPLESAGVAE